ncbi:MAG: DNA polymerase I, partial [Ruminococcus sp.]|nr:DNA polymerase I [Ruminococcus sp.]
AVSYYKANRKGMPPELAQQLPIVKQLLSLMGIKVVECGGYEADDILGTLSKICSDSGNQCFVLTGDRDSLQLIDSNVTVLLATNRETIRYTPEKFREDYGFEPENLVDFKALMGDSSDNIHGVAGIGGKTASALIKEFGTIENLYENYTGAELSKSVKSKLEKGVDSAKESKWLATIVRDVPIENNPESYRTGIPDSAGISRLLTELEMFKLLEKLNISAADISAEIQQEEYIPVELEVCVLTEDIIKSFENASYIFDGTNLEIRNGNSVYTTDSEELISTFFASECEKITIDSKPHYRWAMAHGINLANLRTDAAICGYLLNASASDYTVEMLCGGYGVHYCMENGCFAELASLEPLADNLRREIEKEGMTGLLDNIEMPLTEVLASMEHTGVGITPEDVREFGTYLTEMIEE